MNEVAIQRSIIELTVEAGGYGRKLSNAFVAGMPDLLLIWPGFVPVIAEVKYLGVRMRSFDVQLDVTPLQRKTLREISAVGPFAILLVAVKYEGADHVIGYRYDQVRATEFSIGGQRSTIRRAKKFDLAPTLGALAIPRCGRHSAVAAQASYDE